MSVRVDAQNVYVEGNSLVEDAEHILAALQEAPERNVDLSRTARLHSASIQILLALRPRIVGVPSDPFQARHLMTLISVDDGGKNLG